VAAVEKYTLDGAKYIYFNETQAYKTHG